MYGEIAAPICHDVQMTENTPKGWRERWTDKAPATKASVAPATPSAPPAPPVDVTPEPPRKFESGIFAAKPKDTDEDNTN